MNLKQFWSVLLMSVLIIAVSAMLTYLRDEVFAQAQLGPDGLPVINVPVQAQPPKWLGSFERLEQQNLQQVIIVDPESQRIGVYHVDPAGQIHFVNIRHINADFQLRVFNGVEPLPQYIEQHFLRGNQ